MHKVLTIAKREYAEVAKTKMFWFSGMVPAVLFSVLIFVGARQMRRQGRPPVPVPVQGAALPATRHVVVLDLSSGLSPELEDAVERSNAPAPASRVEVQHVEAEEGELEAQRARLDSQVLAGQLDAYAVVPPDFLAGRADAVLRMKEPRDGRLYETMRRVLGDAVAARRLREHNVPPPLIAEIQKGVSLTQEAVQQRPQGGDAHETLAGYLQLTSAFLVLFLMFLTTVTTSQMLLSSLIEERSSRVLEVLLSAVSPFPLMAGKILGLTAMGLTLAAMFSATVLTTAASQGVLHGVRLAGLCYFLPYYLLGFLLIASVHAAVGAACNTLKEAQGIMVPLMLVFMLPLMGWMSLARNPNGWVAIALSLFPPTTPMVMMLRMATAAVPAVQIALSLVLLAASAVFVTWLSAKIFRTGILMYGKPPRLREMLRWARQS